MAASAIPAMAPPADQSKRTRSPKPTSPPPATISPPQVSCRRTDDVSSSRHARHRQLATVLTPPTPSPHPETPCCGDPHRPSPSAATSAPYYETASAKSLDSSHINA